MGWLLRNEANGSTEPATTLEWNAVATGRRVPLNPCAFNSAAAASTASVGPAMTTCFFELRFAITTGALRDASRASTVCLPSEIAHMAPDVVAASRMSSPRLRAVWSIEVASMAPPPCRAVTSPKL